MFKCWLTYTFAWPVGTDKRFFRNLEIVLNEFDTMFLLSRFHGLFQRRNGELLFRFHFTWMNEWRNWKYRAFKIANSHLPFKWIVWRDITDAPTWARRLTLKLWTSVVVSVSKTWISSFKLYLVLCSLAIETPKIYCLNNSIGIIKTKNNTIKIRRTITFWGRLKDDDVDLEYWQFVFFLRNVRPLTVL